MNIHEYNWGNAFDNGFRAQKAYLEINEKPYNRYLHRFTDQTVIFEKLDINKIKEAFPNAIVRTVNVTADKNNRKNILDGDNEIYIGGEFISSTLYIFDQDVFYEVECGNVEILYGDQDPKELFDKITELLPLEADAPRGSEIELVAFSDEYYTITSNITPTTVDVSKNYNDDFLPVYEDVKKFINDRKSGLVVLRGEKGSGKTTLIRNLITNCPKRYLIVTNAVAERIAQPEFVTFMLEHKDSVFILEDCEQILMKRTGSAGMFNSAIANILNMADGLMSDIFNVKFICTFNADIDQIDEALLRKGRCFANYEFKKLCADKTKVLLNEQGITLDKYEPLTLAEIYNFGDADYSCQEIKKIGF